MLSVFDRWMYLFAGKVRGCKNPGRPYREEFPGKVAAFCSPKVFTALRRRGPVRPHQCNTEIRPNPLSSVPEEHREAQFFQSTFPSFRRVSQTKRLRECRQRSDGGNPLGQTMRVDIIRPQRSCFNCLSENRYDMKDCHYYYYEKIVKARKYLPKSLYHIYVVGKHGWALRELSSVKASFT